MRLMALLMSMSKPQKSNATVNLAVRGDGVMLPPVLVLRRKTSEDGYVALSNLCKGRPPPDILLLAETG